MCSIMTGMIIKNLSNKRMKIMDNMTNIINKNKYYYKVESNLFWIYLIVFIVKYPIYKLEFGVKYKGKKRKT